MKQLIINADDLGADQGRNDGIFEAIRAGIVTSVSILANGPSVEDALQRLHFYSSSRLSLGFHMNLSEGKPLSSNLRLLVGEDGDFLGKASAQGLLMQPGDSTLKKEIHQELDLQIKTLLDAGLRIDHLDGHQHVHVFPAVLPVAVEIAEQYKVSWMRIPEEFLPSSGVGTIPMGLSEEAQLFSRMGKTARLQLKGTKVRTPNHFRGLYLKGRFSLDALLDLLQEIPPGLTELMVHPGRINGKVFSGPFSRFSTDDRVKELETFLDPSFQQALERTRINLTSFPVL